MESGSNRLVLHEPRSDKLRLRGLHILQQELRRFAQADVLLVSTGPPVRNFWRARGAPVATSKRASVTGEFAYEAGTEDSMSAMPNFDLRAWGGFGYAKQRFN